ncbi:hypothetical protein TSAR_003943 [Trichomalopsis sarcophagae]|uniref:Uncharacterized protein n=1 Tax=Trichomalopsis sarcophagae TaxID=543379 RepID=A0A232ET38_9HYME|nr:hypothetical protein TSAR_003943 [Trichomalopsis sarcophagae]
MHFRASRVQRPSDAFPLQMAASGATLSLPRTAEARHGKNPDPEPWAFPRFPSPEAKRRLPAANGGKRSDAFPPPHGRSASREKPRPRAPAGKTQCLNERRRQRSNIPEPAGAQGGRNAAGLEGRSGKR